MAIQFGRKRLSVREAILEQLEREAESEQLREFVASIPTTKGNRTRIHNCLSNNGIRSLPQLRERAMDPGFYDYVVSHVWWMGPKLTSLLITHLGATGGTQ